MPTSSSTSHRLMPGQIHGQGTSSLEQAGGESLTDHEVEQIVRRLEWISRLFDDAYRLPGTSIRLGWDAIIGLVPVVGDALSTGISAYYLWEARRLGARRRTLLKMIGNVAIDFGVGAIPLAGDLADVAWRANRRNMRVLVRELERQGRLPKSLTPAQISRLKGRIHKPQVQPPPPHRRWRFPLIMP